jgi:hypothetical protein
MRGSVFAQRERPQYKYDVYINSSVFALNMFEVLSQNYDHL